MIPGAIIEDFLSRGLDSHLWIKRLTTKQLDEAISQLHPVPRFMPKLRRHQKACFLLGVSYPKFLFLLDMGTGKTLLSLTLLSYWFQVGLIKRALIFLTSDKAFLTWERQIREFGVDLPIVSLEGPSTQKWKQLEAAKEGVALVPYPGALAMVSTSVSVKGKRKWKLDNKLVAKLSRWSEGLVIDESTRCGNHRSLTFKLLAKLKKTAEVRYALTGRPFGRDPTMLWPQYNLIDDGETLGETLGLFRAAFFEEKDNPWNKYAKDYTFKHKLEPKLSRLIQNRSITYSAEECIDLPKVVPNTVYVTLPEGTRAYYKRLVDQLIEAKGNLREAKSVFLRMRQISSGFIGLKDEETGERASIEFEENPKLDRLIELVEELPAGRKAVVFYDFTLSGRKICDRLKDLGVKPVWLWSGTTDTRKELERFARDADCVVAVAQNRLAAMSLDGLQHVANYDMYYESPVGAIDRVQSERRLVRDGQKRTVFRYDLLMKNTVDDKIRAFHKEGMDLFQALMEDPAKFLLG